MGYGVTQDMSKAEEEFKTAVSQSVTLYYYYDSIGSGENCRRYDAPASEEIADFADAKWNSAAYADKLDAIITQKWLHFGFLTSREAWSDIRRTGYPSGLIFPEVSGTISSPSGQGKTSIRITTYLRMTSHRHPPIPEQCTNVRSSPDQWHRTIKRPHHRETDSANAPPLAGWQ